MATLEEIFVKEFKKSRASSRSSYSVFDLNLPKAKVPTSDLYRVRGIEDKYFGKLNNTNVMLAPRGLRFERRLLKRDGSVVLDARGEVVKREVKVPRGSVGVLSPKPIGVPYTYQLTGYGYVDIVESGDGGRKQFLYILPKKVLFKANLTALALSSKKMKGYSVLKIASWGYGDLYLCVIPYIPRRKYENTVILGVSGSLNYDKLIKDLMSGLEKAEVISPLRDYVLSDGNNIGMTVVDPAYDSISFQSYESYSLGDLSDKELAEVMDGI